MFSAVEYILYKILLRSLNLMMRTLEQPEYERIFIAESYKWNLSVNFSYQCPYLPFNHNGETLFFWSGISNVCRGKKVLIKG